MSILTERKLSRAKERKIRLLLQNSFSEASFVENNVGKMEINTIHDSVFIIGSYFLFKVNGVFFNQTVNTIWNSLIPYLWPCFLHFPFVLGICLINNFIFLVHLVPFPQPTEKCISLKQHKNKKVPDYRIYLFSYSTFFLHSSLRSRF